MKNIRIGVKLVGGFVIVALITLILGILGWYGIDKLSDDMEYIGTNRIPDLQALAVLNTQRMVIRAQTLDVLVQENDPNLTSEMQRIMAERRQSWNLVDEAWHTFSSIPRHTDRGRDILRRLEAEYTAWRNIYVDLDTIIEQLSRTTDPAAQGEFFTRYRETISVMVPISDRMGALFDEITLNNITNTTRQVEENLETGLFLETLIVIALVVAVLLSLVLGIILTRAITGPVSKGVRFSEDLAEGDLDARLDVDQKDEIGVLGKAMQEMQGKLREIV
ncbi:MCP four helix bundle domain-containing protein, partial [Desulfonatronum thioautotrophicum]|uniref:MCP four helix bundle domain-containing protein n=1 Tax=Desulfonatronum thioautotrophicum TaxID=617001 RepID=UPI0005EB5A1B